MEISISQLRQVTDILLAHLETVCDGKVEFDPLYHWRIDTKELVDLDNFPSHFSLGDTDFDWKQLQKLIEEPEGASPVHLRKLSGLLDVISLQY
jgi:hypothetical protein